MPKAVSLRFQGHERGVRLAALGRAIAEIEPRPTLRPWSEGNRPIGRNSATRGSYAVSASRTRCSTCRASFS
jgi:hypothetical protein